MSAPGATVARDEPDHDPGGRRAVTARRGLDALLVAVVVLAALVVVAVAAHVVPPATHGGASPAAPHPTPSPSIVTAAPHHAPPGQQHTALAVSLIGLAAGVALFALIGVALMFLVRMAPRWPRMWSERRRPLTPAGDGGTLVDDVRATVEQGLAAIEQGEVADVIIGCWLQLTRVADRAGVALPDSDTPEQTVARIADGTGARAQPLRTLAELYREARFSRHPMGPTQRAAARAAFAAVADDLGRAGRGFVPPDASPPSATGAR